MLIQHSKASEETPRLTIKYSPIIEMVMSLHFLSQFDQASPALKSCQLALEGMDENRRVQYEYLCSMSANWTLAIDLFCYLEQHDIESARDFFLKLPMIDNVDFVYGMFSGLIPKKVVGQLLKQPEKIALWEGDGLEPFLDMTLARKILAEVDIVHKEMASFLQWYWNEAFEEVWRQIGTAEIASKRIEDNILVALGETQYLESCHPGIKIVDDVVTAIDAPQYQWPLSTADAIDVFVTAFSGSNLLVNQFKGTLTIFKKVSLGSLETKTIGLEELAEFLRAISSSTKFQILEELYQSPKTTKELAEALQMAPSSISEHLKTLRSAELLYPQRVKNSVYNRFLYENYQAFASKLLTYFDQ